MDEKISSIHRTSDFNGFEGLHVIIWQGVKDDNLSTRRKGLPYFMIGYQPGAERRSTVAESRGKGVVRIPMKRVSAVTPPERPFEATYADAQGRSASFQIESRFLADVVRRAGLAPVKLEQAPRGRFLMDLRVDQLCSLLMRETERQAPLAPLYFESLATALLIAVFTQADARLLLLPIRQMRFFPASLLQPNVSNELAKIQKHPLHRNLSALGLGCLLISGPRQSNGQEEFRHFPTLKRQNLHI
jgi:hypothetical protein